MRALVLTALVAIVVAVAGCGDTHENGTVRVFLSVPLTGPDTQLGHDVADAARLALKRSKGDAGHAVVQLKVLDGSGPQAAEANAAIAVEDESAVAYLGELTSQATAASIPVTNQNGLLQIGLTADGAALTGAVAPGTLAPSDRLMRKPSKNFVRAVPSAKLLADAVVDQLVRDGVTDASVYGKKQSNGGVSDYLATAGRRAGVCVRGSAPSPGKIPNQARGCPLRNGLKALIVTGGLALGTVPTPKTGTYRICSDGADGCKIGADSDFSGTSISPLLQPADYPPAGESFFEAFKDEYGHDPNPWAIYGYEAMGLALESIDRAGLGAITKRTVLTAAFATENRFGPVGHYDIRPNGDSTLNTFGVIAGNVEQPAKTRVIEID